MLDSGDAAGEASGWADYLSTCQDAGARVVDEGAEFITAQGVFHDLERNVRHPARLLDRHLRRRAQGGGR